MNRFRACPRGTAFAALLLAAGCATPFADGPAALRAIWVTRFDYRSEEDVRAILLNCAQAGFNTVMFQVRGNGTAFYPSEREPWADELGGDSPGFDPLELAIDEAHRHGMELHAWVNVMPSWRGARPPTDPEQLYRSRPAWHWFDQRGRRQPLVENFYVSLNPCLPEVRDYLVEVMREIVAGYPVDGLHLDYIRFVDDLVEEGRDHPRDPATLALYLEETGLLPDQDELRWKEWRAGQVTRLVTEIGAMVRAVRPEATFSAAVGSSPEGPTDRHLRDSRRWAVAGLVDAVFPMNYTAEALTFQERLDAWAGIDSRARIVTGINLRPADRSLADLERQIRASLGKTPHFCLFAYSHLFGDDPEELRPDADRVVTLLRSLAAPVAP